MSEFEAMDRYQDFTNTTCQYPSGTHAISVTLGLIGEAGEFAEKVFRVAEETVEQNFDPKNEAPEHPPEVKALIDVCVTLDDCVATGRLAEAQKKAVRNRTLNPLPLRQLSEEERLSLAKELGDIQWYVAQAARALGYKLSDIAAMNAEKLRGRMARGTIKGSGDER